MEQFAGKIAVVTGGGTGMGRELCRQLTAEGASVAMCDVSEADMAETAALCVEGAPETVRIVTFVADVSDEAQVIAFRDAVAAELGTDHIDLLFNNAGIGGGASMIASPRDEWERVFAVDWWGVYYGVRAFLPLLLASDEGHVVNTSSVNGFHAALGLNGAHTAYSSAKFAVKGFTEALVTDFRVNAPHLHAHVVMPGHIGTSIVTNTNKVLSSGMSAEAQAARRREMVSSAGFDASQTSDEEIENLMAMFGEGFKMMAPTTAADAATTILDGVRANRWRILVGADAEALDAAVRDTPEEAYEPTFWPRLQEQGHFVGGGQR